MHLAFEYLLIAIVIADCRQNGRVDGQCYRSQWHAVEIQFRQKFPCDMLGISGAATISRQQYFAASFEATDDGVADRRKLTEKFIALGGSKYFLRLRQVAACVFEE